MAPAKDILLQILLEAKEKNLSLGKTQLIKLLYLVEVEHYRETGERLTSLQWVFHLYGPYAYELEDILDEREFEKEEFKTASERDFIGFRIAEPGRSYQAFVNAKVSLTVKKVIGTWGNRSLSELLDYVYFQTEPMQRVKERGEKLDFQAIDREPQEPVYPVSATKDARKKVEELRARVKASLQTFAVTEPIHLQQDRDELEAIEEWDSPPEKAELPDVTVKLSAKSENANNTSS
jgi:hypothetical protein